MTDPHIARAAGAIGPELRPGEQTYATFDDPNHHHNGHQDTYLVSKDLAGQVSVEKHHVGDNGKWW